MDEEMVVTKETGEGIPVSQPDIFDETGEEWEDSGSTTEAASNLFTHQLLSPKEAYELSSREETEIIYILGDVSSGKTTLESILYGLFCTEIDDRWYFAGSETLIPLEWRRQFVAATNQRPKIESERTWPSDGMHVFLHLKLYDRETGCSKNVLLSDISGEDYNSCAKKKENITERLPLIQYSNHILLLLDSGSLLDKEKRYVVTHYAIAFMKNLHDSGCRPVSSTYSVIVSKADKLVSAEETEKEFVFSLEKQFKSISDLFDLNYYQVEAKNTEHLSDQKRSTDIRDLFFSMINSSPGAGRIDVDFAGIEAGLRSDFSLLRRRWSNE